MSSLVSWVSISEILRCPRCGGRLDRRRAELFCISDRCRYFAEGFRFIRGKPVLVDFENSILIEEETFKQAGASPAKTREKKETFRKQIIRNLTRAKQNTDSNATEFVAKVLELDQAPLILVVGGGARGGGTQPLYNAAARIISTDIYDSEHVVLLADGHNLPFADGSVHGVWIQAVLEHVLSPEAVVQEIHRVLAPGGLIYAETPFMQQVHEGAYDFTRFTMSGHRWLMRRFEQIGAGVTRGAATTLQWSLRYFVASVTGSYKIGTAFALLFFWLKYFELGRRQEFAIDGASGVYFLGRRSEHTLSPKDMITYYRGAQRLK